MSYLICISKTLEFGSVISYNFQTLFENYKFSDVTLVSYDNIQLKAHKAVLSACSPVLSDVLQSHPEQQAVLFMTGVRCHHLRYLLEFMYLGGVNIGQDKVKVIMDILKELQMAELVGNKPETALS